jgi:prevent-host-death family protein
MSTTEPKHLGVSEARQNLTEVVNEVRLLKQPVILTRRDKPQAAMVPMEDMERILGSEYQPDATDWADFRHVAEVEGTSPELLLNAFIAWYLRRPRAVLVSQASDAALRELSDHA